MKHMKAALIGALTLLSCSTATHVSASITDCQYLYIGSIWLEKNYGLFGVVFLNNPGDPYGSYWTYFNNWTADDRKSALATLTAAKLTQHPVHVTTEEVGGCGIQTGSRFVKSLTLANEP